MLVQGDVTGDTDLLTHGKAYLKEKFDKPGNVFLGLVHRLDRPVSGIVALARTSKSAGRLSEQFRERTPEKHYLAIVQGRCYGEGECVDYLAKQDQKVKIVRSSHPKARKAELSWVSLGHSKRHSLLAVKLKTGRPHQIRVQLKKLGHPIMGDIRYGAKTPFDGKNLALHCAGLTITHPVQKVKMSWVSNPGWNEKYHHEIKAFLAKLKSER